MFSKPFISSVSRLLLCSFLYLNLHSTAIAFIPQEDFIRQQAPHLIVQTVMAPLLDPLDLQKVAALRVLKDVDGVYQQIHFFNFLKDPSTCQPSSDTLDDYDVSDSDEEGLETILDHQKVYNGHIDALGDFIVAEDGSMIFRGDSQQRLSSIAFDTEKSIILDHLNTEKAILSASQAVLRSKASIGSLTFHLQQNAPASLHMLPGSLLQTHEVNLQGGHFVNEGTVEFLDIGNLKVGEGTFYNRGEIHSVHKLSLEAKGLVNAISGNVEAAQLNCQINNAFNLGKLKSSQFTADIAGNFEQSGTIESETLCSIKAQNYSQKGKLKASQVILKAENHSLQGTIESSSLKIHSDQRVEILKPLQGESLHFMGKGTVINRAGIRTTKQLVFENTQTENHAEIVSQGNLKILGSFTNHKSLILDGDMQLTPKAMLQNGTQDNKQATFTVEKTIFDKASFQNYGTAALGHFFGDCSYLDLYKGSQLAIQEADVKVESLQHQGSLSLTSGQIQLQKESQWQADLLSLESNQATLKSNQAMKFLIPENFSWTQPGTLSAPHLIFEGGSLSLKGEGVLQADTLTLNIPQLTNHDHTFHVKNNINGRLAYLENRDEINAERMELPQLKSFKNLSSGQVRFLSYELLGLTDFQNEGFFESDNGDKNSKAKPSSGKMNVSGTFLNSGTFLTRNLTLTAGSLTSTQKFLIPGASQIEVQKGVFQKQFEAQTLTFKGKTLETIGTFKVVDRFYAPSLQNFMNTQNVIIGHFDAPQLTALDVASWQTTSLKANSLRTIKSSVQFVDASSCLLLPVLKTLETKTFEAREVYFPQMMNLTTHHSFRLLSGKQSIIKTRNFLNQGVFEGRVKLESSTVSLDKDGVLTLKGESEILSASTLSVHGKINGEFLTIQAPSLYIYGSTKGSVQSTDALNLSNVQRIYNSGTLSTNTLTAPQLTKIDNSGSWNIASTLASPRLQIFNNSGIWTSGALNWSHLHSFQNTGTFLADSPGYHSLFTIQDDFKNTGKFTTNAEINTQNFKNTGTMTLPKTSSLSVSNKFEQEARLFGDTLKITVSKWGFHDIPASAVYSGTSSLTLNFSGYWLENRGQILTQNLTYNGPKFHNYGVLEGLQTSIITTSGTFENKSGSRAILKNLTLKEKGDARVFENRGELKLEGILKLGDKVTGIHNSGTLILDTQAQQFGSFVNSGKLHFGGTYLERRYGVDYPLLEVLSTNSDDRYHINGIFSTTSDSITFFDKKSCLEAQNFDMDGISESDGKLILRQSGRVTKWGHARAQNGVDLELLENADPIEALETLTVERGTLTLKTSFPVNFRKNLQLDVPLWIRTTSDVNVSAPLAAPEINIHSRSFTGTHLIQSTNAPLLIQTTHNLRFGYYISEYPYSGKIDRREYDPNKSHCWPISKSHNSGSQTEYNKIRTDYSYTWPGHRDYRKRGNAALYAPQGLFLTSDSGSIDLSYSQTFSRRNLEIRAPNGSIEAEGIKMDHLGDVTFETENIRIRSSALLTEKRKMISERMRYDYESSNFWWTHGTWKPKHNEELIDSNVAYLDLGDKAIVTIKGNLILKGQHSIILDRATFCVEGSVSVLGCGTVYNAQDAREAGFFSLGETPDSPSSLTIGQTFTIQADMGHFSGAIYARNVSLQFAHGIKMTGSTSSPQALVPYHKVLPEALEGLKRVFRRTYNDPTTALAPIQPLSASKSAQEFINEAYRISKERKYRQHYELSSLMAMTLEFLLPQVTGLRGFDSGFIHKVYQNGVKALRQGMSLTDIIRVGQSSIFLAPTITSWGEAVVEPHLFIPIQDQQAKRESGIYALEDIEAEVGDDLKVSGYTIQAQGPVQLHIQGDFIHTPQTQTGFTHFHENQVKATSVRQASLFQGDTLIMSIDGQFISKGGDVYKGGSGGLHIHSQKNMNITPQTESHSATLVHEAGKKTTTTYFTEDRVVAQTRFESLGSSHLTSGSNLKAQALSINVQGDLTLGGAQKTNISAQTLQDTSDEFVHLKRSWGRSTDTRASRQQAKFVQSVIHSGGKLIVIGEDATFKGAAIQAKILSNQAQNLTLAHQKAEQKAQGSEKRNGVFSTESTSTHTTQEVMIPTTIAANIIESDVPGGVVTVLNSILEADLLRLQDTNFEVKAEPLRSTEETTQTTSGLLSKPIQTPVSLPRFESVQVADLLAGTAQTVSTALGVMSDVNAMLQAKDPFALVATPLDRMVSVTIGSTKRKTFSEHMITPTSSVKTHLMIMENDFVALKGKVTADTAHVTTKHFVIDSLQDTKTTHSTEESKAVSWSPLSLRKGFVGILPSVSGSSSHRTSASTTPKPSTFNVNQLYLHVDGDALVSGSQIVTKAAEALVTGDLTVESLLNHFEETKETTQWSVSLAPMKTWLVPGFNLRTEQKQTLRKKVEDLAKIVGADHFVMKVGGTLLERSADIGLRADGVPAAENPDEVIKASRRVHEKLDEVDLSKTTVVNLFGSTALTLAGQLEQTPRVLKDIKDVLKSQGKSPEEIDLAQQQAKELMQNPDVAKVIETHEAALQEVEQEVQKLEENLERLEQKHEELAASDVLKVGSAGAESIQTPLETLQAQLEHMDLFTPEGQSLQYHIAAIDHDQKVTTLSHKLLLKTAETVEKFESFLEKNPSLAKTMRYGVEGINGVLMATGVKGLLTGGLPKALVALGFGEALSTASSWAGGKVEGMVSEVATSESEAQRFMKALKTCAETAGVVVGVKIATKTAKSLKASKIQSPVIKDALSERPIIKDGKVWLGDKELGPVRPTPRQSELDVGSQLGPNSRPQVSFSHGKEVRWGAPDSVRPDHIIGNVASIEVKNYDLTKNASKLIYDVSEQALKRAKHLPEGMKQYVRIDARGQIVSQTSKEAIRLKISKKTQGIIKSSNISFFTDSGIE